MSENFYQQTTAAPATPFDVSLRPPAFSEFIGQEKVKDRILLMLEAAKQRGDVLDHVLLSGPPGLGKTTLANLIARAAGTQLHTTSGPQIEKAGDLAGILTNIQKGDILFIDEIHRLHPAIEEYLYPAMEDFRLDIIIDSGPSARSIQINLPKFTLVGATTRSGMLTAPLRSRFGLANRLDYYTHDELAQIIERSAGLLDVPIERDGALEVASRSRGTPRVANALLRWVRDFAQVRGEGFIDGKIADAALAMIEIDSQALTKWTSACSKCLSTNSTAARSGSTRSPSPWVRTRRPSRRSTSRFSSCRASSCGPRAGAPRCPPLTRKSARRYHRPGRTIRRRACSERQAHPAPRGSERTPRVHFAAWLKSGRSG
jgi:Holliday junction DNA helicase RuvB